MVQEVVDVRGADQSIKSLEAGDLGGVVPDVVSILAFMMSQSSLELICRYNQECIIGII